MIKKQIKNLELISSEFALSTDFYELTMAAAYLKSKQYRKEQFLNYSYENFLGTDHIW